MTAVGPSPRWFGFGLSVLTIVGIALRIAYAMEWQDGKALSGDPLFYQQAAAQLSKGHGYAVPFLGRGTPVPTALHPPLFSTVLALFNLLGVTTPDGHRIALAAVASAGIIVMGLLGQRILGPATGLAAASIAALGPLWIQPSGKVLSESVYLVLVPIVLLAALRSIDRPTYGRFAFVGLTIGLAALTRGEALTLVVLIGTPLVLFASRSWRERAQLGLALLATFALVVGPWLVRNEIQMGGLTLSTNSGTTLVGAYSPATFSPENPLYGSFDGVAQFGSAAYLYRYVRPPNHARHWTELTLNSTR